MVLSLYAMVVCIVFAFSMQDSGNADTVVLVIGYIFCTIAEICYTKTIDSLREDIVNLKKQIDTLKE